MDRQTHSCKSLNSRTTPRQPCGWSYAPGRHNVDGTVDSICKRCFLTVAHGEVESELQKAEAEHVYNALNALLTHRLTCDKCNER